MTILFVGGEAGDFDACNMNTVTTANYFRSAYARCAIGGAAGQRAVANITASTTIWLQGRAYIEAVSANNTFWGTVWEIGNASATRWRVQHQQESTNSTFQLRLQYRNTSNVWTTTSTISVGTPPTAVLSTFAAKIVCHASTGTVDVYYNGTLVITFTGDTIVSGSMASVTQVAWAGEGYNSGATNEMYWSECIVADTDIRNLGVARLYPSAAGATSTWTGTYAEIDESTLDDTDTISSGTNNQESQFALADLGSVTGTLNSVIIKARAAVGTSGPAHIQLGVRISSTNYLSGDLSPPAYYGPVSYTLATNPATSTTWTVSDVNAMQLAVKSTA